MSYSVRHNAERRPFRHAAFALLLLLCIAWVYPAHAACTNPAGNERDMIYNGDYHVMQFCNGTSWVAVGAITGGTMTPTTGSGFFVLTKTKWNGNLGGISGANAKCLTELSTTNTTWKGYATASANGMLTSLKVHAFMCGAGFSGYPTGSDCNELQPSTTYYFAYAGDASKGGATLTTDANRVGPNDNADWSDISHFGVATERWDDRYWGALETQWGDHQWTTGANCQEWTSGSSGDDGANPITNGTDSSRWMTGGTTPCNNTLPLICYVNP